LQEQWLTVQHLYAVAMNTAVDRMQDMVEQIAKLTGAQQLYQDAISLKEREFSVCTSYVYTWKTKSVCLFFFVLYA